jgi:K+-sensing histidine kinase KdpD
VHLFDEIIKDKELTVDTSFEGDFTIRLHPFLADTLVSNLVGNAIKYNHQGGKLAIAVSRDQYCISNSSELPGIEPQQLFKRFKASSTNVESSTGLGLAIVKRITDTHDLDITYQHETRLHRFCLQKRKG